MGGDDRPPPGPSFESIADLSSDSVFVLDREHRITYINRTAEGLRVEDAIGTTLFDLLTEDQARIAREAFERAARTGDKTSYEVTFPLPDGRLSRWLTRIGPRQDGGFVVVSSDVTAQASTREELDLLFDLSRDLLFVSDYDGQFMRVSPAAIDALGYSYEELTTRPFLDFVHPDDRERTLRVFGGIVEDGRDVELFENRYATKAGGYRLLQWTARPDPASRRIVGIARDVTESRAMEQQLRQAQKMDAVGQLAGGIAHDFNNLIQAIFGSVDLARSADSSAEVLEHVEVVEQAAHRASELTRQLLSFSRQQPLSTSRVDMNELVRRAVALLRRVLPATIEVRVVAEQAVYAVDANAAQLEQALLNLCLNARDAMPSGGALTILIENIEVDHDDSRAFFGAKAGRHVALTVADEGTGMTAEVRERIFEPFFSTKPTGQGTGLGMSMVYGAVVRHGGTIHVNSQPACGTRVCILLPAATADSPADHTHAGQSGRQIEGHGRILLAEDDPLVRRLCMRALEKTGYEVLAAANGAEAVELARAHPHLDLAILDVIMPRMTGPEAYAAIQPLHPNLPVLFSSGYSDVSNHSHAVPDTAPLLAKPLRMSELLETVGELLDRSRS